MSDNATDFANHDFEIPHAADGDEMQQILVYGDSLTWGIIPGTRRRLSFDTRWPGVMELSLNASGHKVRVIEDCLNGRRTVWEDPFKPGRNGLEGIEQRIEINSPLAVVIVMLGTNDFQCMHPHSAWHAAEGVASIVRAIRRAPIEPGMSLPEVVVVVPPQIQEPKGPIAAKFAGAAASCAGLAGEYRRMADELGCQIFDAGSVTGSSVVDGIHLDADQHITLGRSLAEVVKPLLRASHARSVGGPDGEDRICQERSSPGTIPGSDRISWQVELAVKPGQLDNFRALTNEMVESTRSEPGVLIYERFISDDGHVVELYERYADSAAALSHLLEFQRTYGGRFMSMVNRHRFTVFGTPSDELRKMLDGFGATYARAWGGFSR